jgi:hypothetical protein
MSLLLVRNNHPDRHGRKRPHVLVLHTLNRNADQPVPAVRRLSGQGLGQFGGDGTQAGYVK